MEESLLSLSGEPSIERNEAVLKFWLEEKRSWLEDRVRRRGKGLVAKGVVKPEALAKEGGPLLVRVIVTVTIVYVIDFVISGRPLNFEAAPL